MQELDTAPQTVKQQIAAAEAEIQEIRSRLRLRLAKDIPEDMKEYRDLVDGTDDPDDFNKMIRLEMDLLGWAAKDKDSQQQTLPTFNINIDLSRTGGKTFIDVDAAEVIATAGMQFTPNPTIVELLNLDIPDA